ncbi:CO-responsive transcriptional regulator RcoM [Azospira sp. I13]|uniref:LytTR family transcriptional regulator n=1 Tax=Azospira sp. I13 TaxID=1765050 RepID=UPI000D43A662|nr:LytTR family transcriptional regulator DNA-binding domain-containing protein [Azospira sp. I13]GBG03395.1 CO-responsive transcriptional regulator RcoM [Azospira sp. I13]
MESPEYLLQKMDPGVVMLDREGRIRQLNPAARRLLQRDHPTLEGRSVVELHPEPSRRKIAWLLQEAASGDVPVPVTMTINTPERPLLLSISRLEDAGGPGMAGFCLLLYDYRGLHALPPVPVETERRLAKLPVLLQGGTALLDPAEVVHLQAEGHYARLFTARESFLCPLSLAQLERRLEPQQFLRIHRRHFIAIAHAARLERQDGRPWVVMATFPATRLPIGRSRAPAVAARLGG